LVAFAATSPGTIKSAPITARMTNTRCPCLLVFPPSPPALHFYMAPSIDASLDACSAYTRPSLRK